MSIQNSLNQLTLELQSADLWDREPPSAQSLMSSEPFCVDTLNFEQWLQWIFIPKLHNIIATPDFAGLPNTSDIHTMAEYVFKDYPQKTQDICNVIKELDSALNAYHN